MGLYICAWVLTQSRSSRVWLRRGVEALLFSGILIGVIVGSSTVTYITKTCFAMQYKKQGRVIPKECLPR